MDDINPFTTKDYISPEYFCDREKEIKQLINSILNQRNTTILSQRKIGKTSLIKHLLYTLKDRDGISVHYFDLYPTLNLVDFTNLLCNSLMGYYESKPEKVLQKLIKVLGQFRPKITVDEYTGRPSLGLDLQSETETGNSLGVLFNYLDQQDKKVVLAIDEFQQITKYPETNVEAVLRSHIQASKNIVLVFSGSSRHMLTSIFNDYARPFYQSTGFLFLDKIEPSIYKKFISDNFIRGKAVITPGALEYIMDWTMGVTYFVQEVCNRLYSQRFNHIDIKEVKQTCLNILEERTPLYLVYAELLTNQQMSLLRALAHEIYTQQPTSAAFLSKYSLGAASTVRRSMETLETKNMIITEEGKYTLPDVFLMRWLQWWYQQQ